MKIDFQNIGLKIQTMFGFSDYLDLECVELVFNVIASPNLMEDAQTPGLLCYFIDLETPDYGRFVPNPKNLDELTHELDEIQFPANMFTEQMLELIKSKNGQRTVVLIMRAPKGSPHVSVYRFSEDQILNEEIFLGEQPPTEKLTPWFSREIKVKTFESLMKDPHIVKYLKEKHLKEKVGVVMYGENINAGWFNLEAFEKLCRGRLINLKLVNQVKKYFNEGKQIMVFVIENYLKLYPLIVEYRFEEHKIIYQIK